VIGEKGVEIKAHKAILCARSEYFKSMFKKGFWNNEDNKIVIQLQKHKPFRLMLQYLYSNQLDIDSENISLCDLIDLQAIANEYMLTNLAEECLIRISALNTDYADTSLYDYSAEAWIVRRYISDQYPMHELYVPSLECAFFLHAEKDIECELNVSSVRGLQLKTINLSDLEYLNLKLWRNMIAEVKDSSLFNIIKSNTLSFRQVLKPPPRYDYFRNNCPRVCEPHIVHTEFFKDFDFDFHFDSVVRRRLHELSNMNNYQSIPSEVQFTKNRFLTKYAITIQKCIRKYLAKQIVRDLRQIKVKSFLLPKYLLQICNS
jgi:hypothetical protein